MTVFFGRKLVGLALGAAAIIALPSAASAVSYNITSFGIDTSLPGTEMWANIKYSGGPSGGENAWVGRLALTGTNTTTNATQTLLTWCIDVFDNLKVGTFQEQALSSLTTPSYTVTQLNNLEKLMTNIAYAGPTPNKIINDTTSAAAQLAIWEVLNETSGTFNVTTGTFMASGGTMSAAAYTQANSWLGQMSSWTKVAGEQVIMINPNNSGTYVRGSGNQAQIYVAAVPEPASWMTMLLGFGAIGSAVRRRRTVGRAVA